MIKRIIINLVLAMGVAALSATDLFAGAWTQEQSSSYHRAAVNYYYADEEYDQDGDSRSMAFNGEFTDFNLSYYGEYGLIDELTIFTSIYYKDIEREDDYFKFETDGMGDMDLGARFRLHTSDIGVFSAQGLVKIPEFYDEDDALPLGNGQYDYELKLLYGHSLWPVIPGYMNLEAGYRWRAEDPSDEFRYLVEVGSDLGKNFYARAKLDAIVSMDNSDETMDINGNPTTTLEYDLAKLYVTLGYQLMKAWGVELEYVPPLWGENTAKGATWTLAVTFQPCR
ncbi:MAG: hypothetical protein MUE70_16385 [Desulfobacterales bacterium]|jgi:hypothetical protein|nr:hypothetical protein [Desulfobacterales bacterium]